MLTHDSICIVSILRLHSLIVLGNHPEDSAWHGAAPAYFSAMEVNLGIVCASLPALKPLVARIVPGFLVHQNNSRSHLTRTTTSNHRSSTVSGGSHRYHATVESRFENGFEDDFMPPMPLQPNQIFVTRKFERRSDIDMDFEQMEGNNGVED